jgi:uncharacterized protein (TIGR03437 family)
MGMYFRIRESALRCAIISFLFCSIPAFGQGKLNHYAVYLADQPAASRYSHDELATQAAVNYRQQIADRQAVVTRDLESRQIHVTGAVTTVLNAIFIATTEDRIAEVESIPGVTGVRRLPPVLKRFLNKATAAAGAPAAWTALGGQSNAGAGIKIAVLDTGIDQTHPAFQDPSLTAPAGFPKCTQGHPEDCAFTNNKVIVARSYVRQIVADNEANPTTNPAADSMPDDYSPRDRTGHGTAIASAAAGNQNSAPAVPFSGMAPKAFLGNYKIWGTQGVNDYPSIDVWIQALDDAVSDGMDVISMSDGGSALTGALSQGPSCSLPATVNGQQNNYCDPLAAAFESAAHAGVAIAVAAGNGGSDTYYTNQVYPTFNSIISPATAPSVIAVGALLNSHVMTPSVSVTAASAPSSLKNMAAANSDSFFPPTQAAGAVFPAQIAPLVDVTSVGDTGYACSALPAGSLNNVFALIQRGSPTAATCTFATKTTNAQNAGAIGVVIYNNVSTAPTSPEGVDQFTGPVVMISQSAGAALKTYIDANEGALVTIDTSGTETDLASFIALTNSSYAAGNTAAAGQLASYSSMGPTPDGLLKPDMTAVGGSDNGLPVDPNDYYLPFPAGMYLAAQHYDPNGDLYSQNGYTSANGTSFATPLVAGAAALMKQAHPSLRGTQIKSLLVNSAGQNVSADDFGDPVDAEWMGAGSLNAGASIGATVTAEPATISFGVLTSSSLPMTKTITLTNLGSASVTLTATVSCCSVNATPSTVSGTTVAATLTSATVGAAGTATLTVTLSGKVPSAGEYSGYVALKGGSVSLQIPFMYLVSDGIAYNAYQLAGFGFEGLPNTDQGYIAVQVTDQFGIPLAGQPMSVSVSPRGSVTLKSVAGEPACSGTTTVTCNTDNFGVAYAEVILGSSVGSTPTITATAAGTPSQVSAAIMAAPSITAAGIVNDGSFQQPVAPGSWVAIFGSNLVNTAELSDTVNGDLSTSYLVQANMLPLVLDGTTVSFDVPSAGISVPGYVYYVNSGQIDVWVPWELEGQSSAQVKVTVDEGLFGNVVTLPLSNYAPAFFLNSGNVADALDANYKIITASNPAVRGQYIALYVNGLGPTTNQPASGAEAPGAPNLATTTTQPVVTIGGVPVTPVFSGLAPGIVGEYQVNVQVPTSIAAGNQPITISIGGVTSPAKTAGSSPQTIMLPVK